MKKNTSFISKPMRLFAAAVSMILMLCTAGVPLDNAQSVFSGITAKANESYAPRTAKPSESDANYFANNPYYQSGYGLPNCTCYAFGRAMELLGYRPNLSLGNADEWWGYNLSTGAFPSGSEPRLGAVACWAGQHVAVVEAIEGDTIWISQSSWRSDRNYNADNAFEYTSVSRNNMNSIQSGFQGYIYLGDWDPERINPYDIVFIPEGRYMLCNIGTQFWMNYGYLWYTDPKAICGSKRDNNMEQQFYLKHVGNNKYELHILHSDGGVVNSYAKNGSKVCAGTVLTRWDTENDDTQRFCFHRDGNHFYISSATNPNVVITASGSEDGQLVFQSYSGNANQQWMLLPLDTEPSITNPYEPAFVKEGVYQIWNIEDGRAIKYDGNSSVLPHMICTCTKNNSVEQTLLVKHVGGNQYEIYILHSDGGIVNSYCEAGSTVTEGIVLNRMDKVEGDESRFYFYKAEAVSDANCYYISSVTNKNCVITAPGKEGGQLFFDKYYGSTDQQWKLVRIADAPVTEQPEQPEHPVVTEPVNDPGFDGGIDVSVYQKDIDWQAVAGSGITFVIIRAATTNIINNEEFETDARFQEYLEGAKAAGLKVGAYFYTSANTKAEMKANIDNLLKTLAGKHFDLPVYLDFEGAERQSVLGKAKLTELASYGCSLLRAAGYQPGVYANLNWYLNYLDADTLRSEGIDIWMAAYPYSNKAADPADYDYSASCTVWQYSDSGSVPGISTAVDVDVRYGKLGTVAGDVNADGTVTVADVILLQKWLSAETDITLPDWKAADVSGDSRLDAKDLSLLKRIVMEQ